jgi:hypothetical protein
MFYVLYLGMNKTTKELNMEPKVTKVRYFETNRGLGYEALTDIQSDSKYCKKFATICNDGNGGCTYVEPPSMQSKLEKESGYDGIDFETYLENLINKYEGLPLEKI